MFKAAVRVVNPARTLLCHCPAAITRTPFHPPTTPHNRMFGSLLEKVGYETLPAGIEDKSFYDLKAAKGKSSQYDFVRFFIG